MNSQNGLELIGISKKKKNTFTGFETYEKIDFFHILCIPLTHLKPKWLADDLISPFPRVPTM